MKSSWTPGRWFSFLPIRLVLFFRECEVTNETNIVRESPVSPKVALWTTTYDNNAASLEKIYVRYGKYYGI